MVFQSVFVSPARRGIARRNIRRQVADSDLPCFNLPRPEPLTLHQESIARFQDGGVNVRSTLEDSSPLREQQGLGSPIHTDLDSILVDRRDCAFDTHLPSAARSASVRRQMGQKERGGEKENSSAIHVRAPK